MTIGRIALSECQSTFPCFVRAALTTTLLYIHPVHHGTARPSIAIRQIGKGITLGRAECACSIR